MKINYGERLVLEAELKKGTPLKTIAKMLGVDRQTLYVEFKRTGMNRSNYRAETAQLGRGTK